MTMTKQSKDAAGLELEPRRMRRELFDDVVLDKLMAATDERGVSLTGEGGFLPEMIKAVLERGMQTELTDQLGYEKGDRVGHGSGTPVTGLPRSGWAPRSARWRWNSLGVATARSRRRWCPSAPADWAG